ncbi:hypothetical protein D3C72_1745030 [compost metagenome]
MFEQGFHDEAAVVLHIGHHHAQQVVHLAGQRCAFHHFGPVLHALPECIHGVALMRFGAFLQAHVQVGSQAQAHFFRWHQGHIALYHPRLFQALDAAQHRAGRQAHLLANYVIGFTAVFLQAAQDGTVQLIEGVFCSHGADSMQAISA